MKTWELVTIVIISIYLITGFRKLTKMGLGWKANRYWVEDSAGLYVFLTLWSMALPCWPLVLFIHNARKDDDDIP